jgi:hypothetical protein
MIWHNAKTNPPPEFEDVLLAVAGEPQAAEGNRQEVSYWYSTGHLIIPGTVYAWTELPACPQPSVSPRLRGKSKGGAS